MLRARLAYLRYVVRHKWFVFLECCKLGIPWLGVIHDLSKLLPSEFIPYALHFYGPDSHHKDGSHEAKGIYGDLSFDRAWNYHQKRNRHHWQYWILIQDEDEDKVLKMPDKYQREMLADWKGAGRAITGQDNTPAWYAKSKEKMQLHQDTRAWIEREIYA